MTGKNGFSRPLLALAGFSLLGLTIGLGFIPTANAQATDSLYVGDAADNTVKRFDASTGQFLGAFVKRSLAGLHGPRGLILDAANNLTIVDQNAATSTPGEVLQYGPTGALSARIVPHSDQHAPAVPRGMILWRDHLFVAEFIGEPRQNKPPTPGRLLKYTSAGNFVADLTPATNLFPGSLKAEFHPRGVVIGPDDRLYVSNVPELPGPAGPGLGGQVLRFDPDTGAFIDVFINSGTGGVGKLNRPRATLLFELRQHRRGHPRLSGRRRWAIVRSEPATLLLPGRSPNRHLCAGGLRFWSGARRDLRPGVRLARRGVGDGMPLCSPCLHQHAVTVHGPARFVSAPVYCVAPGALPRNSRSMWGSSSSSLAALCSASRPDSRAMASSAIFRALFTFCSTISTVVP